MDPYMVLGISRNATPDEIKKAYKKKVKQHHPDVNQGDAAAESTLQRINEAYEALTKPKPQEHHFQNYHPFHKTPFGGGFRFRFGDEDIEIDEYLRSFYNRHQQPRADISTVHSISLDEAFAGVETDITYKTLNGLSNIKIKIPPGIDNNTRLKVQGKGNDFGPGSRTGDLYITISIKEHKDFTRQAQNLFYFCDIDFIDAILGTNMDVPTIEGTNVKIQIPNGTQHSQRFRVSGKGMPVMGNAGLRGDMIVQTNIIIPRELDDESRKLLEKVRNLRKN